MFLVLVVHANFWALGAPTQLDCQYNPIASFSRYFFQALSIGCVDMFVLLSGWFGIRPKLKSFVGFIFQCLFFLGGIYAVSLLSGLTSLSVKGLADLLVIPKDCFWFIKSYILLYILAPILNSYIDSSNEKQLRNTLVCFYIFQIIYGWIYSGARFFIGGYSTISFIGLYLLARYVRLFPNKWTSKSYMFDFLVSFTLILINGVVAYTSKRVGLYIQIIDGKILSYISPLVIVSSLYFLIGFSKLNFSSKIINWLGVSSFAVYLFHQNPNISYIYKQICNIIFEQFNGISYLFIIICFLIIIFLLSVIIDQLRIFIWNRIWGVYERGSFCKSRN